MQDNSNTIVMYWNSNIIEIHCNSNMIVMYNCNGRKQCRDI